MRLSPEAKQGKDTGPSVRTHIAHQASSTTLKVLVDFIVDENQSCREIQKDLLK